MSVQQSFQRKSQEENQTSQTMHDAAMFDDDVISGVANAMLFERACVLLPADDRDHT